MAETHQIRYKKNMADKHQMNTNMADKHQMKTNMADSYRRWREKNFPNKTPAQMFA